MLKNLLCKSFFIIQCILRNKIIFIIFAHICANKYDFMNEKFAKKVCQILEIKL